MPIDDAPLAAASQAFLAAGVASFTTPGHGRRPGLADALLALDLPLSTGADDLRLSGDLLGRAQALAASLWGADRCWFLVNGSTQGNEAMALAAAAPRERVLVSRTMHKSLFAGLVLAGLDPVYVRPDLDPATGLPGRMDPARIASGLAGGEIRAVFLTEPSYVGAFSDVATIAGLVHDAGATLLVDGAWGAHLGFHPALPRHALACGADALVLSTHKTLPAFTQSALLLARAGRLDLAQLDRAYGLLETTSPSCAIYASIDTARETMAADGERLLSVTIAQAARIREALEAVDGVTVAVGDDPTKLVILLAGAGADGFAVERDCEAAGIRFEMLDRNMIVPLLHVGTHEAWVDRLCEVLPASIESHRGVPRPPSVSIAFLAEPEPAITPRRAFFAAHETVSFERAVGRISAETVTPYPPGIPALAPGEVITAQVLDALREEAAQGSRIAYCTDPSLETLVVVSEVS
jgi:lysine decarboxylase